MPNLHNNLHPPARRALPLQAGRTMRNRKVVYYGCMGVWATLLSEAANAWWGTQWVLPIAHDAAGLKGEGPASRWMEVVVQVGHVPFACLLATVVSTYLSSVLYFVSLDSS